LKSHGADLLAVAVDLQGPDKPRPYVEAAGARFGVVVDQKNILGSVFGYRAIPNGVFIGEDGALRFRKFSGFDIRKSELAAEVLKFASGAETVALDVSETRTHADYFERGLVLYEKGDLEGAKKVWREGIAVEPDHWNMRKQLWAIEHPERFYDGAVDYGWQKQQVEQGQ
jgi:hypothetical protein